MHDIIIIGAGPAGLTAALYALRADKKVLVIEKDTFGGQITFSPKVENYPALMQVSGNELADMLLDQVISHGADIEMAKAERITPEDGGFTVTTDHGSFTSKAVIIAAGSKHRHLGLDREEELTGEGVSYCAVCDGAFYAGRDVAVIGGGNTALQEAVMLSEYCKKVYVIQNLATMTGEGRLVAKLETKDNVSFIFNSVVTKLVGDEKLRKIEIRNTETNEEKEIELDGLFVAIGQVPENQAFENIADLNDYGYIDSGEDCLTKTPGVFVAGDCRKKAVRQITTATADGAVAALAACRYIDR
ncbi:MAG: FAD-dependent oxidoreductase [Ruminococcaceae bacterium]|nr:FAD-dependent oxidoreductase [Oscillospiraceae bacterium]